MNKQNSKKNIPQKADNKKSKNETDKLLKDSVSIDLSKEIKNDPQLVRVVAQMQKMHSGPLPSPENFEKYEKVLKGSADRIMTMAEKEQNARIKDQEKSSENFGKYLDRSFIIMVLVLGLSAYVFYLGYVEPALALGIAGSAITILKKILDYIQEKNDKDGS